MLASLISALRDGGPDREHEVRRGYKRGRGTSGTKRSGGGVELYSSFMHPLRFVSLHSSPSERDSAGSDAEYILSFRVYRTPIIRNFEINLLDTLTR